MCAMCCCSAKTHRVCNYASQNTQEYVIDFWYTGQSRFSTRELAMEEVRSKKKKYTVTFSYISRSFRSRSKYRPQGGIKQGRKIYQGLGFANFGVKKIENGDDDVICTI